MSNTSENAGHFLELHFLFAKYTENVASKLQMFNFTGYEPQNELLHIVAVMTRKHTAEEVYNVGFLLFDY